MSGRFFLDTNIFVYTFDSQTPAKSKTALHLIQRASDTGEGIVSYQVVQEFFNVAFRRFSHPMSRAEAEQYFITVFRPLLAIHSSPALIQEGLRLTGRYKIGWYDALVVGAALEGKCSTLYTEDLQDGREIEGLRIQNPFR